jgi:hypothetical protein
MDISLQLGIYTQSLPSPERHELGRPKAFQELGTWSGTSMGPSPVTCKSWVPAVVSHLQVGCCPTIPSASWTGKEWLLGESDIRELLPTPGEFYLHITVLGPSWPLLPPVVLFRKEFQIQGQH